MHSAVAVVKDGETMGYVLSIMSSTVSQFLKRTCNTGFAEVTGGYMNRGVGYGLEVPSTYKFFGPEAYIKKLKEVLKTLQGKELLFSHLIPDCIVTTIPCMPEDRI